MPIRNVSKSCAVLHKQMGEESFYRDISSTQYLDAVKVLPLLFKPMQKKLLATKNSLQNGIDQVLTNFCGYYNSSATDQKFSATKVRYSNAARVAMVWFVNLVYNIFGHKVVGAN